MRPRTPDLDSRILDAAASLFAGNHFHEVRMEDIATEASVGKGTLYRYFKDKEELYLALLDRAADQIHPCIEDRLATAECPTSKLVAVVGGILSFFDEQPHLFELIQQAEARMGTNHPWQKARVWLIQLVHEIFNEARIKGDFDIVDQETTTLILLGGLRAIARMGERPRAANLPQQIVNTVLRGAQKATTSRPVRSRV